MMKPLIVLVSGAPGSGKSTLAGKLAEQMRLVHIPRDEVLRAIEFTKGERIERGVLGIETYFQLLTYMVEADISVVTDGTIYKDLSEDDIKTRLTSIAHVVNVHTHAEGVNERFREREKKRGSDDWVEGHMARLREIYPLTAHPLDLGVTLIEVDATHEYVPSLNDVVAAIKRDYEAYRASEEKKHEATN